MTYYTQAFSEQAIQTLSNVISAFLADNPSYVPISITNVVDGANFYALLLYSIAS